MTDPDPYDTHAGWWHARRDITPGERDALALLTRTLAPGDRLLDLGCGSGTTAAHFTTQYPDMGFHVTGLDRSPAMLSIAREHAPDAAFIHADIRDLPSLEPFHAILSWDGFFHLTQPEQRAALPRILALLKPRARLLLTVGPDAGDVIGQVNGESVHHSSLSAEEYATIFAASGVSILLFSPENASVGGRTLLLAEKTF